MSLRMTGAVPAPSPSPVLVQLVDQASAPVWLAPLLTGFFVLVASLIALYSLYRSDLRKLRREDQRQWDRDLRQAYVDVSQHMRRVLRWLEHSEGRSIAHSAFEKLADHADAAGIALGDARVSIEMTAPPAVISALEDLQRVVGDLDAGLANGNPGLSAAHLAALKHAQHAFERSVREGLRI